MMNWIITTGFSSTDLRTSPSVDVARRPHTPWCDGVEPLCLRPHRAGSTIPRLRPTGSSLGIAPVDYDPVVLHKPFGPRLAAGALPSRASSMVAPGRPIRVPAFAVVPHEPLHTFHPLWPVRHYPHLRISVRGPGPSGTSTHLTRQLPGTHYARHDYEELEATVAQELIEALGSKVASLPGQQICDLTVSSADEFRYTDPVDHHPRRSGCGGKKG